MNEIFVIKYSKHPYGEDRIEGLVAWCETEDEACTRCNRLNAEMQDFEDWYSRWYQANPIPQSPDRDASKEQRAEYEIVYAKWDVARKAAATVRLDEVNTTLKPFVWAGGDLLYFGHVVNVDFQFEAVEKAL